MHNNYGTQQPESGDSEQGSDAADKYSLLPSSSSEEGDHTPRLSLWDLQCMWDIQGGMKLTLNSPTVAGNHCTTSDHNFECINYAVPSHETRDINDDGGVPTLPISSTNAAVTDAGQIDTTYAYPRCSHHHRSQRLKSCKQLGP